MSNNIFKTPEIQQKAYLVLGLAGVLVGLQVVNVLTGYSLNALGIIPRELVGLWGIIISPFLHGSFGHLWSNLFGFVFLSSLIIWKGVSNYLEITIFIILSTGSLVWLLGPGNTIIVGASGLVFGYVGYLIFCAVVEKSAQSILTAMAVGFLYGGLLFGIFPGTAGISWESHLAGFVSGIFAAVLWKNKVKLGD